MGEQFKVNNHLSFGMTNFYKENKQWILGITVNKEEQSYASSSLYKDIALKSNKYEFNLWLLFIGLHMSVKGKKNK